MIFLLKAYQDNEYILISQDYEKLVEHFHNSGCWTPYPPSPKQIMNIESFTLRTPNYWWQKHNSARSGSIHAKVIRKFSTLTDYLIWYNNHPELFI